MTARSRLLALASAGLLALLAIWYFAAFRPQTHRLTTTRQTIATLQASIPGLQSHLADLEHQRKLQPERKALLAEFDRAIPPTADPAGLIEEVSRLASRTEVNLSSLSPSPPATVSGLPVAAVSAAVAVSGRYSAVKSFLDGLYHLPRLVEVTSVQMSAATANQPVQASFQIQAFTTQAVTTQP